MDSAEQPFLNRPFFKTIRFLLPFLIYAIFFLQSAITSFLHPNQTVLFLNSQKMITAQIALTLFLISLLLILIFTLEKKSQTAKDLKSFPLRKLPLIFVYLPLALTLSTLSYFVISIIDPNLINQNLEPIHNHKLIAPILIMMLATGYMEEIFFRGYLPDMLETKIPKWAALFIATLLFSIGHGYQGLSAIPATFALGLLFYGIRIHSKSLHLPALTHGLYNSLAILISFIELPS